MTNRRIPRATRSLWAPALATALACSSDAGVVSGSNEPASHAAERHDAAADALETEGSTPRELDAGALRDDVTVQVTLDRRPSAGVPVIFHDAAGVVLESVLTNALGFARSSRVTPSMATALLGTGQNRHVVTWLGVERGDLLETENWEAEYDHRHHQVSTGAYAVEFPSLALPGGMVSVGLCNAGAFRAPAVLPVYSQCATATSQTVLLRAFVGSPPLPVYAWRKGVTPPPPLGAAPVSLPAPSASERVSIDLTGRNANDSYYGLIVDVAEGQPTFGPNAILFRDATDSATFMPAQGFAEARQVTVLSHRRDGGDGAYRSIIRRGRPTARNVIDLSDLLPKLTSASVLAPSPERFELNWTSSAPLASADGGVVRVRFDDPRVDEHFAWSFVVPPGTQRIVAPKMPDVAAPWLPNNRRARFKPPHVWFLDWGQRTGYAAMRRDAARLMPLDQQHTIEQTWVMPEDGELRVTTYYDPRAAL